MNEHESENDNRGKHLQLDELRQHTGLVFGVPGKGSQPGLVAALVIVAIGVILLLDQEGVVRIWDVWRFWPVVLIIVGLVKVLRSGGRPDKPIDAAGALWGLVEIGFGVVFLLGALGYPHFSFGHTWPLLIVGAGLWMVYQKFGKQEPVSRLESNLDLNRVDVFGGGKVRVTSRNFRGGKWLAVFGGSEIDFRNADMEGNEATLEVLAIFGGGELIVPRNWEIQVRGVALFGGHNDETERPLSDSTGPRKVLVIKGAWILGGFNVKN
jgi:predicted membrane protein